jgi:hypothetical protein
MSSDDAIIKMIGDMQRTLGETYATVKLTHDGLIAHIAKDEEFQASVWKKVSYIDRSAIKEKWLMRGIVGAMGGGFYKGVELLSTLFFGHHR